MIRLNSAETSHDLSFLSPYSRLNHLFPHLPVPWPVTPYCFLILVCASTAFGDIKPKSEIPY